MNMKIVITAGFVFLINTINVFSQQTHSFSEYNYNPFIINSAYAGLSEYAEFSINNSGSGSISK